MKVGLFSSLHVLLQNGNPLLKGGEVVDFFCSLHSKVLILKKIISLRACKFKSL